MAVGLDTPVPLHRLSLGDYHDMAAAGILGEDDRVELLYGALVEMSPKSPRQATAVTRLTSWLAPLAVAGAHELRIEQPISLPRIDSEPEPDVAVVAAGGPVAVRHPATALLVIEVALTSHRVDRVEKAGIYASAGIADYWVLDLVAGQLEVRREPDGGAYRACTVLGAQDRAAPLELPIAPLELGPLLETLRVR